MTQLAETVNTTDELWTLDTLPITPVVQVEDELVEVRSPFPSQTYTLTGQDQPPRIRVRRGAGGTTPASHNSGTTLTPVYGLGGGSDEGGVTINLTGTETEPGNFFRGDEDPADTPAYLAILAPGDKWTDTTFGPTFVQKERNAANDGWNAVGLIFLDPDGGEPVAIVIVDDGVVTLQTGNDAGNRRAAVVLDDSGGISINGYGADGTTLQAGIDINFGGGETLTLSVKNGGGTRTLELAAAGLTLDTLPIGTQAAFVDPATANAEDIANALIASGLMAPS